MSDAEAVMWAVEKDPAFRSDFCNLTLLERPPDEKRLRATLARALRDIPRLRRRVISAPLRLVPPEFADDPGLDLEFHVRRIAVPPPGDTRTLLDVVQQLAETPLDRSRPLWEFTVIDGLAGGRAALVQKVHHTITDGIGGLKLSLALLDFEADPAPVEAPDDEPVPVVGSRGPLDAMRSAVGDAATRHLGTAWRAASATAGALVRPHTLPGRVTDSVATTRSLVRQGFVSDRAHSQLLAARSLRRHFEVCSVPLAGLRAAATAFGGSVNDAYVTGICLALGRYHERYGSDVSDLRMAMPISTRAREDDAANRFAPARVVVPIGPARDPRAVFDAVHARIAATKEEPALGLVESMAGLAVLLPTSVLVGYTRNQARTIDFATSNMRGSPVPLYLAGARIEASYPFGPRAGAALNVTTIGYCDSLDIGVNVDPAAIQDIDGFMADLADGFASLVAAGA